MEYTCRRKAVMQQACESDKRPKFRNGKLYIDGVLHNNEL